MKKFFENIGSFFKRVWRSLSGTSSKGFLLKEDGGYLLKEDGDKIKL